MVRTRRYLRSEGKRREWNTVGLIVVASVSVELVKLVIFILDVFVGVYWSPGAAATMWY